jgi:hypothetical protein
MLFAGAKKEALAIHERAVNKYNALLADFQYDAERLYVLRQSTIAKIKDVEALVNSIANTPKEFEANLVSIEAARTKFRQTEEYAAETYSVAIKAGVGGIAGVGTGAAVAGMAPAAAMWVATTFGTASTGTAISTLSGAAATKAALAWIGGGALAAGGGGTAAGQAFLSLAGPIGWSISAGTTIVSAVVMGNKNRKISKEAVEEAKEITIAGAQMNESHALVLHFYEETELLFENLKKQLEEARVLRRADYSSLTDGQQLLLGALVNNTMSLAQMLNKTIE